MLRPRRVPVDLGQQGVGIAGELGFDVDLPRVALALVDEGGRRVFTAQDLEDLSRGSALVGKLASVAAGVSALFWKPELKNGATTSPSNGPPGRGVVPSASSSPA